MRGTPLTDEERALFSEELLPNLYETANMHDVTHLVAKGLSENGMFINGEAYSEKFKSKMLQALYRYEQMNYVYCEICSALEKESIPYMPLKGSILRSYYPEPWMRTSCDIDVLVHKEDLQMAVSYLTKNLNYEERELSPHDVSLYTSAGIHIELHFDLVEDGRANNAVEILRTAWDYAVLRKEGSFLYDTTDDFFYFYHIAHMAKHFEIGGCGVRTFIDQWILDNMDNKDQCKRDELLKKGGLSRFAEVARHLSKVWLDGAEHTEITKQLESFIVSGGAYGTTENRVAVQQQKKGGKLKYALSRVFIPYEIIKYQYPILQKHRWLTPIMEIRRWCKLVFCGGFNRSVYEFKKNSTISKAEAENIQMFLSDIGL